MEQRKLIRLGNSSFAIALPKDWVDKSGLKKGDDVFVTPNSNGEIIVSSEFKKNRMEKEIRILLDNKNLEKARRDFISAYINGATIFKFEGDIDNNKRKYLKKVAKDFISCEVAEEKEKLIYIKDFFDFEELNIDNFTRRADNNVRDMFNILIGSIKNRKISNENLNNIKEADSDINKIYFLNSRLMTLGLNDPTLVSTLKTNPSSLFSNWWLTFHLEHIGDSIKGLKKMIKESTKNIKNHGRYVFILNDIKKIYETSLKSFYDRDKKKANEVMEEGKSVWDKCDKLIKEGDPLLSLIAEKLKSIENASYQIVKIIINMET